MRMYACLSEETIWISTSIPQTSPLSVWRILSFLNMILLCDCVAVTERLNWAESVFHHSFWFSPLPYFSTAPSFKVQITASSYVTKDDLKIFFSACFFFRYMPKVYKRQ